MRAVSGILAPRWARRVPPAGRARVLRSRWRRCVCPRPAARRCRRGASRGAACAHACRSHRAFTTAQCAWPCAPPPCRRRCHPPPPPPPTRSARRCARSWLLCLGATPLANLVCRRRRPRLPRRPPPAWSACGCCWPLRGRPASTRCCTRRRTSPNKRRRLRASRLQCCSPLPRRRCPSSRSWARGVWTPSSSWQAF